MNPPANGDYTLLVERLLDADATGIPTLRNSSDVGFPTMVEYAALAYAVHKARSRVDG